MKLVALEIVTQCDHALLVWRFALIGSKGKLDQDNRFVQFLERFAGGTIGAWI
jgi:hypothetical protein